MPSKPQPQPQHRSPGLSKPQPHDPPSASTPIVPSDPDSMANQIVAASGNLLPMPEALDFILNVKVAGYTDSEIQYWTGYASVRDFYEAGHGIVLGDEIYPGWHKCQLPEGWTITYRDSTPGVGEDVVFFDADGKKAFSVITNKNATDLTAMLGGLTAYDGPRTYNDPISADKMESQIWDILRDVEPSLANIDSVPL